MAVVLMLMPNDSTARPQVLWSSGATAVVLALAGLRELRSRRTGQAASAPRTGGDA
jgi:aromatic amino acid permease